MIRNTQNAYSTDLDHYLPTNLCNLSSKILQNPFFSFNGRREEAIIVLIVPLFFSSLSKTFDTAFSGISIYAAKDRKSSRFSLFFLLLILRLISSCSNGNTSLELTIS